MIFYAVLFFVCVFATCFLVAEYIDNVNEEAGQ